MATRASLPCVFQIRQFLGIAFDSACLLGYSLMCCRGIPRRQCRRFWGAFLLSGKGSPIVIGIINFVYEEDSRSSLSIFLPADLLACEPLKRIQNEPNRTHQNRVFDAKMRVGGFNCLQTNPVPASDDRVLNRLGNNHPIIRLAGCLPRGYPFCRVLFSPFKALNNRVRRHGR